VVKCCAFPFVHFVIYISLCSRFYDVDEGSITVGGIDIRELDPSWLRGSCIGFINQEPVLFATSIMENIRYGKPSASDSEVLPFCFERSLTLVYTCSCIQVL
jgi:ABC-type bacteriocin/lantibiotic exporter with double-glycine peptidase domain